MKPAVLLALALCIGCSPMQAQPPGHAAVAHAAAQEPAQGEQTLVAAFNDRGALRQRYPEAELVGRYGEVAIWRLDLTPAGWRELAAIGNYSPVFGAEQGQMRALPGGVVVRLVPALKGAKAEEWFRAKSLSAKPLSGLPDTYLVATPAGLAALELSKQLDASPDVVKAEPNWWQAYSTRK